MALRCLKFCVSDVFLVITIEPANVEAVGVENLIVKCGTDVSGEQIISEPQQYIRYMARSGLGKHDGSRDMTFH